MRRHQGARRRRCRTCCACATRARHRAVPGGRRTRPTRWARASPVPGGAGPARRRVAPRPRRRSSDDDAERALLLWVNEPGQPDGVGRGAEASSAAAVGVGPARGIVVASDECYAEFTWTTGDRGRAPSCAAGLDGVLAVHRLSKRSNLAGMRVGFYAGDPTGRVPRSRPASTPGSWCPAPMQAAAAAALGDDDHVDEQRARYAAAARRCVRGRLAAHGLVARRRPVPLLPLAARRGRSRRRLGDRGPARRTPGTLVAPGDLYGAGGADHVRLALVQPDDRLELALDRLARRPRRRPRDRPALTTGGSTPWTTTSTKQITQLWEPATTPRRHAAAEAPSSCAR